MVDVRPGATDLQPCYGRAFEPIGAMRKAAGVGWDDVVDIQSFHTDLTTQMPAMVAVKNRYIQAPFPAWTAIQVVRLIPDNGITEIKFIAKLPTVKSPPLPRPIAVPTSRMGLAVKDALCDCLLHC